MVLLKCEIEVRDFGPKDILTVNNFLQFNELKTMRESVCNIVYFCNTKIVRH